MKYPIVWEHDGGFRDIYVFNANLDEWQRVIDFLHRAYSTSYYIKEIETPMPSNVRRIFQEQYQHGSVLVVDAAGVDINCHFFLEDEIEFNLYPDEVNTEDKEEAAVRFMRDICAVLGKPVVLTLDGAPAWVCLRLKPGQEEPDYTPIKFEQGVEMSRDEGLRLLAKQMGIDENDQQAVIERLLESINRPHVPWRPPESEGEG